MSSPAGQAFIARALKEEGLKLLPYDDETGLPVKAPVGNLSWGIGFNLMQIGSLGLFGAMIGYLVDTIYEPPLLALPWYTTINVQRQSVFVDIAYNDGVSGLLDGFPLMLAAAAAGNWTEAAAQCKVAEADLDESRYAPLRAILLSGVASQ